jgi:hypothetical protein
MTGDACHSPQELLQERTDLPEPSPMSPPARTEPSQRLCASSNYGNLPACRAPKHNRMRASRCTWHPARKAIENESHAADRRVEEVHQQPRKSLERDASSERNPTIDQRSRARAPGVTTGSPTISDSSDLAPNRLAPYRLDAPTSPSVSLRERWSSATWCFRHRRAESECPTLPASVGAPSSTSPPRIGSRRSDCRGAFGCLETTPNHGTTEPWTMPFHTQR